MIKTQNYIVLLHYPNMRSLQDVQRLEGANKHLEVANAALRDKIETKEQVNATLELYLTLYSKKNPSAAQSDSKAKKCYISVHNASYQL